MGFNKLYILLVVRIMFLTASIFAVSFCVLQHKPLIYSVILILVALIQTYSIYRSLCKSWEHIEILFEAIENDDFSSMVKARYGDKAYRKLIKRMNNVLEKLKHLRIQNEQQAQYLNAIVENINIGVVVINDTENIDILNRYARKVLGIGSSRSFSAVSNTQPEFYKAVMNLSGGRKTMVKLPYKGEILPVSVILGEHRFLDKKVRIITFQSIKSELEEKELESWQNLIRVLTHEIMNSIGPMTSTIDTLTELINDNRQSGKTTLGLEITSDVEKGIRIIKERSLGMHDFIRRFRSITLLPKLNCIEIPVNRLFDHVTVLFHDTLEKEKIQLRTEVFPVGLVFNADKALVEQILINLVQNAIDAISQTPNKLIELKAFRNLEGQLLVEVSDNGPGISDSLIDKIFIPFFTTKENGSGIGLSLARQIMKLHNGKIAVYSKPGEKTVFSLVF